MKANIFVLAILLATGCAKETPEQQNAVSNYPPATPGDYVIEMKDAFAIPIIKRQLVTLADKQSARDTVFAQIKSYCAQRSINVGDSLFFTDLGVGFAATLTSAQLGGLIADSANVAAVIPDFTVRLVDPAEQRDPVVQKRDPIQQSEWDLKLKTPGVFNTCAIEKAGGSVNSSTKTTKIFILDTGVDDHESIVLSRDSSRRYIDTECEFRKWRDFNGHGTVVAGIAASKEVTYRQEPPLPTKIVKISVGVSAGACVVSYKVLDSLGHGKWRFLRKALDDVAAFGRAGDVVNMSLGAYCPGCSDLRAVLESKITLLTSTGIFVVMAAGNDSGDANLTLPGSINGPNLFTVASIDCDDACSFYSNYGSSVDWLAVGTKVFSTYRKRRFLVLSGTSMSTAVVTGIIHARGGPPVKLPSGSKTCNGGTYSIARRCATPGQCPP
ncbi:MAG TPA: S8 family serine peptidase [Chryseolinea sp.]|nr:S8 family serine peptidase [Chryseolinea sp.]